MANGTDTFERLRTAIWAGAGMVLASVGVWTGATLDELSDAVGGLHTSVSLLEQKITMLPPPEMLLRIEILEKRLEGEVLGKLARQHDRIDRLEERLINGKNGPFGDLPKLPEIEESKG